MKLFLFVTMLFSSLNVFASSTTITAKAKVQIDKQKIESLVNDYYLAKSQKSSAIAFLAQKPMLGTGTAGLRSCDPHQGGSDCLNVACNHLPSYKCDDQSEINQILTACRGVDGDCIQSACSKMPSYKCDDVSEIEEVGRACRDVFDGDCMNTICGKMASYKCDDLSEITQVATICKGRVESSCIESVCTRLPSYKCDDLSELQEVAKSCGGN